MKKKIIKHFSLKDLHIRHVLRSGSYNFITKILGIILGFVLSYVLAHTFGSETIGIIALLHSLIGVSLLIGSFGFPKAILRLIPEYKTQYGSNSTLYIYLKVLIYLILFSTVSSLFFFLFKDLIKENFFENISFPIDPILIIAGISIGAIATISYNSQSLRAFYSDLFFNILMLSQKLINLILLTVVILFYNTPVNAIYANLATSFFVAFLSLVFVFSIFKKLKVSYTPVPLPFGKIWDLAWPMFLTSSLFMVMNQTDTLMLGYIKQPEDVGIYHIVSRIAGITLFVLTAMNYRSAPLYAELYHAKQHIELKNLVQRTAKIMFWMTLPIVIVAITGGKFLLGIFGDEFITGYFALLCIVFAEFIHAFSGSIGNFLNMTGHQKVFRNIILIGVSVNITLNFLLIPLYSYNGAAFATLISMITWNAIGSIYIKRTFGYYIGYLPFLTRNTYL